MLTVKRIGKLDCYIATTSDPNTGHMILAYGDSLIEAITKVFDCLKKYLK